jgi:hypothetical protein
MCVLQWMKFLSVLCQASHTQEKLAAVKFAAAIHLMQTLTPLPHGLVHPNSL